MKKLWQAVLETQKGNAGATIFFDVTDSSSPYGEATLKNIHSMDESSSSKIAVNPYYRHEAMLGRLIKPGKIPDLTVFLCDLILHHIFEIDALEGMDLEEFYFRFLEEDLEHGALGTQVHYEDFPKEQKRKIAYYYLRLCRTGNYESCFSCILQELYQEVWVSVMENGGLVVVVGAKATELELRKVKSLQNIFLPVGRTCRFYWGTPPCIIGCPVTTIGNSVVF